MVMFVVVVVWHMDYLLLVHHRCQLQLILDEGVALSSLLLSLLALGDGVGHRAVGGEAVDAGRDLDVIVC